MIVTIQNRRGVYTDFDPSRLLPGEFAIVQSGDPESSDGVAIYVCVSAGNVKKLASHEDIVGAVESITNQIATDFTNQIADDVQAAEDAAESAEASATSAAQALSSVNARIDKVTTHIAKLYDPTHVYAIGDWCVYNDDFYVNTYYGTTGTFKTIHWVKITLDELIGNIDSLKTTNKSVVRAINEIYDGQSALTEEVSSLNERLTAVEHGAGLTNEIKQALLQLAEKVAYIDEDGQDYYDALESALYPPADLSSISAVYTPSGTVYIDATLDSLKNDLVVTAIYSDATTEIVTAYTLSGSLEVGANTITVSYGGKTTTFIVTASERWEYHLSDMTKVVGALGSNKGGVNPICAMSLYLDNANRRSFVADSGETSIALTNDSGTSVASETSDYYPIKVPSGADTFTINITPSTQYIQCLARELNDGVYSVRSASGTGSGYNQGTIERTFTETAGDNVYLFISSKYDNSGTSYPTEPTELSIIFS